MGILQGVTSIPVTDDEVLSILDTPEVKKLVADIDKTVKQLKDLCKEEDEHPTPQIGPAMKELLARLREKLRTQIPLKPI